MDTKTIAVYNRVARQWAEKYNTLTSKLLQKLALEYFHAEKKTLEIGCGSGRNLGFLNQKGFPTTGLDASEGLLHECQKHSPDYDYVCDSLPLLEKVAPNSFYNIYSSAVLMHLGQEDISLALENIGRILKEEGIFVFSYRHSSGEEEREQDGRLFTFIEPDWLQELMEKKGFQVLFYTSEEGFGRPKFWHHFAVRVGNHA